MKRLLVLSIAVLAAGNLGAQPVDQRPGEGIDRIVVVPFVNSTDVDQWDNLARDMTETIRLTLLLGERYDVVNPDLSEIDPYAPDGPLTLRRIADDRRIEAAVIGRISETDNGRVELEASVWSNATGQIVGSQKREAFGSFDILDAADELVALATSALLGYAVDFGAIVLEPSRSDVEYTVSIDGHPVGVGVRSIPQVLVGQRRIDVSVTVAGQEQLVYSAERRIRPGEAIEVSFGLPRVTRQEQREILTRHELARNLLGQPDDFRLAFEALTESRSRLAAAQASDTIAALRERQTTLERAWQLDEEFFRLTVSTVEQDGGTEAVLPGTYRLIGSINSSDAAISSRVRRNGAAYYHMLRMLWAQDLGSARWDAAGDRLDVMESVVADFDLEWLRTEVTSDRRKYRTALDEADRVRMRRRRPWPYIGIALGLGGVGYGGYLVATEADVFPGERDTIMGREFARSDVLQWGSIGVGGAITAISTAVLVRNLRADENYLREWARSEYGFEIDRVDEIRSVIDTADDVDAATVVVLGPADRLVAVDGRPQSLPLQLRQDPGHPLVIDAPVVVSDDRTRLYGSGVSFMIVR